MDTPVTGQALTKHAKVFYGIERDPGESDDALRARCASMWPQVVLHSSTEPMSIYCTCGWVGTLEPGQSHECQIGARATTVTAEDRARFAEQLRSLGVTVVPCEPSEADRLLLAMVRVGNECDLGDCHFCCARVDKGRPCKPRCPREAARLYLQRRNLLPIPSCTTHPSPPTDYCRECMPPIAGMGFDEVQARWIAARKVTP